MHDRKIVALDQGTTSTRALRFDRHGNQDALCSIELTQHYPGPGWVEHDPEEIWRASLDVLRRTIDDQVAAIGITNQRETVLLWDRASGQALHPAIVWQDRRTAPLCAQMAADGVEPMVRARTGLLLDPYFSASKLRWMLDHIPSARQRAARGELAAGTIDCFLLWRLTGGRVHATDATNAARTLLYDISRHVWDEDLLRLFDIPRVLLPQVHPNCHLFGETDPGLFGRALPIAGMAGDQQAALIGQACFLPGMVKSTYGTGCFLMANSGAKPVWSEHRLLTTIGYRIGAEDAYALEGSIFVAGAAIKWLRDSLGLISAAQQTAEMAAGVPDDHGVHVIPAFVGLGAPHWRSDLRASISGLTFDCGPAHLVRATLEAIAFQTHDLIAAMAADGCVRPTDMRIDGGMANNRWFAQFLADMLEIPIDIPANPESTAFGAACLAGLTIGLWQDFAELRRIRRLDQHVTPAMKAAQRQRHLAGWRAALGHALQTAPVAMPS